METNTTSKIDLTEYDVILLSTSGGKDSSVMLHKVAKMAAAQGVSDRLVAVHADLEEMEWEGVPELAERQAVACSVEFKKVVRPQGNLLEHVLERGAKTGNAAWMSSSCRFCTSDHKRGQILKVITKLVDEHQARTGKTHTKVLNVMGMRAEESTARSKKAPFAFNKKASNGKRTVMDWLPIHSMTEAAVWGYINFNGIEYHPVYDQGMGRLSCCFCVLAPKSSLVTAAMLNMPLAKRYEDTENTLRDTGVKMWKFTDKLTMAEVVAEAQAKLDAGEKPEQQKVEVWCA